MGMYGDEEDGVMIDFSAEETPGGLGLPVCARLGGIESTKEVVKAALSFRGRYS